MNLRRLMKASIVWSGMLWSFESYGQIQWKLSNRGQRIPLGAIPMQYNSSFAGEAGGPRLSSSASLRTSYKPNSIYTYDLYASYDQFIPAIQSGIGITAGWSGQASQYTYNNNFSGGYNTYGPISSTGKINDYFLSVAIAPKFSIKGKYTLSPSIDFTYRPGNYSSSSIASTPVSTIISFYDYFQDHQQIQSRIGLLFNTNKYYIGYSVYLINQDTFSARSKEETYPSPRKDTTYSYNVNYGFLSYLQLGYTFQRSSKSKFSFTPQLVLGITDYNTFNSPPRLLNNHYVHVEAINLNFKYQQVIFGLNNRGWHVGWQTDKLRLMLSNNFGNGYYDGNLSLRYLIRSNTNTSPNLPSGY